MEPGQASHWVFGYGSLMWRPGFAFIRAEPARLHGFHRRLCVYSHHYRGTPEKPGLVFGLDRGGSCRGVAFEVTAARWPETLAYLREREQLNKVYRDMLKPVYGPALGGKVSALVFVVDRRHAQYAGDLATEEILRLVKQGEGRSGQCQDYVRNTVHHLRSLGIHDARLEILSRALGGN